jgi:hypothetical protein
MRCLVTCLRHTKDRRPGSADDRTAVVPGFSLQAAILPANEGDCRRRRIRRAWIFCRPLLCKFTYLQETRSKVRVHDGETYS